ncbi:MAG: hypothetical protein WD068_00435 [Candidatus Babeliales bacterium]
MDVPRDLFIISYFLTDIGPNQIARTRFIDEIKNDAIPGMIFDASIMEIKNNQIHLNYQYDDNLPDVVLTKEEFFKLLDQWFETVKRLPKEIVVEKTDSGYSIHPKEGTTFWTPSKDKTQE